MCMIDLKFEKEQFNCKFSVKLQTKFQPLVEHFTYTAIDVLK